MAILKSKMADGYHGDIELCMIAHIPKCICVKCHAFMHDWIP